MREMAADSGPETPSARTGGVPSIVLIAAAFVVALTPIVDSRAVVWAVSVFLAVAVLASPIWACTAILLAAAPFPELLRDGLIGRFSTVDILLALTLARGLLDAGLRDAVRPQRAELAAIGA